MKKSLKVRVPFTKNQKAGPITSKKDKKRRKNRKTTKSDLKRSCWED